MRSICRGEGMPSSATFFQWIAEDVEFAKRYARCKEVLSEHLAEEILSIADDSSEDWIEQKNEDGVVIATIFNKEAVARARLRVDARKWIAAKLLPKKYGDTNGANINNSVVVNNLTITSDKLRELQQAKAALQMARVKDMTA